MSPPARVTEFSRLLWGNATRKGRPGGREGTRGTLLPSMLCRNMELRRTRELGHILRMDERQTVHQVLLNYVKPTPESIFGDLLDLDVNEAISLAKVTIEWKKNRLSKRC